jgi:hypothetical protein
MSKRAFDSANWKSKTAWANVPGKRKRKKNMEEKAPTDKVDPPEKTAKTTKKGNAKTKPTDEEKPRRQFEKLVDKRYHRCSGCSHQIDLRDPGLINKLPGEAAKARLIKCPSCSQSMKLVI